MHPAGRDDIQLINEKLESLRADLDAVRSTTGSTRWGRGTARPGLAKRLTGIGIVALMLALPVIVSASHQFTDVPTSHTFHTAISRLYGARLTTGCSSTRFCPGANVTRGQMAAFLNRGLGRGAVDVGGTGLADDWATFDNNVLARIDLQHGGAPGGTGHVLVTANATAYTTLAGTCPCELSLWLVDQNSGEESAATFQVITDVPTPPDDQLTQWYEGSAAVTHLFTVQSGVTGTYDLGAFIRPTTAPTGDVAGVEWNLTAVYVPFGANGGNPSLLTTQNVDGRRGH